MSSRLFQNVFRSAAVCMLIAVGGWDDCTAGKDKIAKMFPEQAELTRRCVENHDELACASSVGMPYSPTAASSTVGSNAGEKCEPPKDPGTCDHELGECISNNGLKYMYEKTGLGHYIRFCLANCKKCLTTKSKEHTTVSEDQVPEHERY